MADDKQIQQALAECEGRFLKVFRESPLVLLLTSAKDDRYIEINDTFERRTGWRRDEVVGRTPLDIDIWVDPDERVEFLKQLLSRGNVRDFKLHGRMKNGEVRTGSASAALIEINGEPCVLTLIEDTTDLRGAEEAKRVAERLSNTVRRLLHAHEEEHTSIVRELRKYIESLALVMFGLERLQHNTSISIAELNRNIAGERRRVEDLFNDIQNLSHQLRSPKLEYLGIESAASSFCRKLSDQKNIHIDFAADGVPDELPHEVSLALFHVLQEALQNVAEHSRSQRVKVLLTGRANELDLIVRDWGVGFAPEEALKGGGLGLTIMKERLKLVDGELSIESQPQYGTTIYARVPLRT